MSIVRVDEFAAHLGVSTPPSRSKACLDMAEALVASYLSIEYNQRGDALQEHTVSQRVTPVRDRLTLEMSGGPVTGIESIWYESETEYVYNPDFSNWVVSGRNEDGTDYIFKAGTEYLVTYRTGWCRGDTAYNWQWYRNSSGSFTDADRLGWTFATGDETATNSDGELIFGASTSNPDRMYYEMGVVAGDALQSPTISVDGKAFPFIVLRSNLERASTTGSLAFRITWLDGDGRTYHTGKKISTRGRNARVDHDTAQVIGFGLAGYRTDVLDMGYLYAGHKDEQLESLNRAWRDSTITEIRLTLWTGGADAPNGAKFDLDYVKICDGLARIPEPVSSAVLETAKYILEGGGSGIQMKSVGDYSESFASGEASSIIPPGARMLLQPYRRASW